VTERTDDIRGGSPGGTSPVVRRAATHELLPAEMEALRALMWAAFAHDADGEFSEDDWQHALGGVHVVLDVGGTILSHASVVERILEVDGRALRTGYVEAVATRPGHEGRGYGSAVMAVASDVIRRDFELGALGTGRFAFYERLGWERWRGPSSVRATGGTLATPDEDGWIMVLRTPTTGTISLDAPISCDWRPGDVW
jgi:aminoglycoside 2'-N-acetyltransferase I